MKNNNQTVNKLVKYESKMAKYRKNLQRRNKKRALYEAQFEIIETEVKLPYEIRKTKPNPSKGVKTDCVFKWSKIALDAKKTLHDMKIRAFHPYKKGDTHFLRETYHHPKLSELTFEKKELKKYEPLTKEQQHEMHVKFKEEKAKKLESREFSLWHNKLIAKAFSTVNQRLKQAAEAAAHETKIQKLIKQLQERKLAKCKYRLEFRKLKGTEPIIFNTLGCNKTFAYLNDAMSRLSARLAQTIEDFISINIIDNKTNKLLKVHTGWKQDDIHYKIKLANMKALYPEYYNAA